MCAWIELKLPARTYDMLQRKLMQFSTQIVESTNVCSDQATFTCSSAPRLNDVILYVPMLIFPHALTCCM